MQKNNIGLLVSHLFEQLVGFILLILDRFSQIMLCFIIVLRVIPCSSGLPGTCNPPVSAPLPEPILKF